MTAAPAARSTVGGPGAPLPRSVHAWYGSGAVATGIFNTVPGLLFLIGFDAAQTPSFRAG